jgi:hypothetical protein
LKDLFIAYVANDSREAETELFSRGKNPGSRGWRLYTIWLAELIVSVLKVHENRCELCGHPDEYGTDAFGLL